MAAGSTYTPIATYTVPSAATDYTFSSIPGTYTDLVIIANLISSASSGTSVQFNGDTGSNYNFMYMFGNGSGTSNGNIASTTNMDIFYGNTTISTQIAHIQSYANTSVRKNYISRFSPVTQFTGGYAGEWASTAAITSIKLLAGGNANSGATFSTGTTFTLYGIKAA